MADLLSRLKARKEPIRFGLVGVGSLGGGLVYQSTITPGVEVVAIADIRLERAVSAAESVGRDYRVVESAGAMHDAIRSGRLAICQDGQLVAQCESAEVFVEASSSIGPAAGFALTALGNGKHLVMANAEADLIFGPYLMTLAWANGVVYTNCDGDQPTVIARLIEEVRFWGFELVMAGNIKGFLDRYSDPTRIIPEANKRGLDHKMCASYTDGTKLCIEMALVANGLGLRTAVPGMYGPRVENVRDAVRAFDLDSLWDGRQAVVDYVLGAQPHGGIFAIGHTDNAYQRKMLAWFPNRMGDGPYYVFYRPYHLIHVEGMVSIAEVVLDRRSVLEPVFGFQTNVYAYAKRDLRAGEVLDGIGGYCCYGLIENCSDNLLRSGLPICLAENVTLKRDVRADEKILMEDVAYDPDGQEFSLYARALEASNRLQG